MIDPRELRIGNWIKIHATETKVGYIESEDWGNFIGSSNFAERPFEEFEPILLTEEWLIKFGFEKTNFKHRDKSISRNVFILGNYVIQYIEATWVLSRKADNHLNFDLVWIKSFNHLHQLQNVYFALTGKELEIR